MSFCRGWRDPELLTERVPEAASGKTIPWVWQCTVGSLVSLNVLRR